MKYSVWPSSGLGKMGLSHLSIANALDDFEVVAVCDNSKLVTDVLGKVTGLRGFNDYDEVLRLQELDAVIIATPTIAHEPMIRKALDRGLHVFAEKPLNSRLRQPAANWPSEQPHKGLVAQVGYHNRYVGTFAEAARLLADRSARQDQPRAGGILRPGRASPDQADLARQGGAGRRLPTRLCRAPDQL